METFYAVEYMHTSSFVFGLKVHVRCCTWIEDTASSVFYLTCFRICCTCDDYCVTIYHGVIEATSDPTTQARVETHDDRHIPPGPSRPV
jgi:hypothetical protein